MNQELIHQAATAIRTLSMHLAEDLFGLTPAPASDPAVRRRLAEDLAILAAVEQTILRLGDVPDSGV